jgi:hypothetical protein
MTIFEQIGEFFMKFLPYEVVFWGGKLPIRLLLIAALLLILYACEGKVIMWKDGYTRAYARYQTLCLRALSLPIAMAVALEPKVSEKLVYAILAIMAGYACTKVLMRIKFARAYRGMKERDDMENAEDLGNILLSFMVIAAGIVYAAMHA